MSSVASPTPQSHFAEAPSTNIRNGDEEEDRLALLPELNAALSQVNQLLGEIVHREGSGNNHSGDENELEDIHPSNGRIDNSHRRAKKDLPWMALHEEDDKKPTETTKSEHYDTSSLRANLNASKEEDESENVVDHDTVTLDQIPTTSNLGQRTNYSQRELRNLATVFDRLGRTLTDAAPHIASLAESYPEHVNTSSHELSSVHASSPGLETSPAPLGGLLSLWSRERRRQNELQESPSSRPRPNTTTIDPDHVDFASGVVNTTRGEARSGPRSRSSNDDVANLLGTYLATASLGGVANSDDTNGAADTGTGLARLLQRGSGGASGDNGIDIHIHAIVTAPGISPGSGGLGIATVGSGGSSPAAPLGGVRNLFSSNMGGARSRGEGSRSGNYVLSTNANVDLDDEEDYSELFSELYSENPIPIDPNGSTDRRARESQATSSPGRNNRGNDANISPSTTLHVGGGSPDEPSFRTPPGRIQSSPRRQSAERRSGVFRLFRRRSSRPNRDNEDS